MEVFLINEFIEFSYIFFFKYSMQNLYFFEELFFIFKNLNINYLFDFTVEECLEMYETYFGLFITNYFFFKDVCFESSFFSIYNNFDFYKYFVMLFLNYFLKNLDESYLTLLYWDHIFGFFDNGYWMEFKFFEKRSKYFHGFLSSIFFPLFLVDRVNVFESEGSGFIFFYYRPFIFINFLNYGFILFIFFIFFYLKAYLGYEKVKVVKKQALLQIFSFKFQERSHYFLDIKLHKNFDYFLWDWHYSRLEGFYSMPNRLERFVSNALKNALLDVYYDEKKFKEVLEYRKSDWSLFVKLLMPYKDVVGKYLDNFVIDSIFLEDGNERYLSIFKYRWFKLVGNLKEVLQKDLVKLNYKDSVDITALVRAVELIFNYRFNNLNDLKLYIRGFTELSLDPNKIFGGRFWWRVDFTMAKFAKKVYYKDKVDFSFYDWSYFFSKGVIKEMFMVYYNTMVGQGLGLSHFNYGLYYKLKKSFFFNEKVYNDRWFYVQAGYKRTTSEDIYKKLNYVLMKMPAHKLFTLFYYMNTYSYNYITVLSSQVLLKKKVYNMFTGFFKCWIQNIYYFLFLMVKNNYFLYFVFCLKTLLEYIYFFIKCFIICIIFCICVCCLLFLMKFFIFFFQYFEFLNVGKLNEVFNKNFFFYEDLLSYLFIYDLEDCLQQKSYFLDYKWDEKFFVDLSLKKEKLYNSGFNFFELFGWDPIDFQSNGLFEQFSTVKDLKMQVNDCQNQLESRTETMYNFVHQLRLRSLLLRYDLKVEHHELFWFKKALPASFKIHLYESGEFSPYKKTNTMKWEKDFFVDYHLTNFNWASHCYFYRQLDFLYMEKNRVFDYFDFYQNYWKNYYTSTTNVANVDLIIDVTLFYDNGDLDELGFFDYLGPLFYSNFGNFLDDYSLMDLSMKGKLAFDYMTYIDYIQFEHFFFENYLVGFNSELSHWLSWLVEKKMPNVRKIDFDTFVDIIEVNRKHYYAEMEDTKELYGGFFDIQSLPVSMPHVLDVDNDDRFFVIEENEDDVYCLEPYRLYSDLKKVNLYSLEGYNYMSELYSKNLFNNFYFLQRDEYLNDIFLDLKANWLFLDKGINLNTKFYNDLIEVQVDGKMWNFLSLSKNLYYFFMDELYGLYDNYYNYNTVIFEDLDHLNVFSVKVREELLQFLLMYYKLGVNVHVNDLSYNELESLNDLGFFKNQYFLINSKSLVDDIFCLKINNFFLLEWLPGIYKNIVEIIWYIAIDGISYTQDFLSFQYFLNSASGRYFERRWLDYDLFFEGFSNFFFEFDNLFFISYFLSAFDYYLYFIDFFFNKINLSFFYVILFDDNFYYNINFNYFSEFNKLVWNFNQMLLNNQLTVYNYYNFIDISSIVVLIIILIFFLVFFIFVKKISLFFFNLYYLKLIGRDNNNKVVKGSNMFYATIFLMNAYNIHKDVVEGLQYVPPVRFIKFDGKLKKDELDSVKSDSKLNWVEQLYTNNYDLSYSGYRENALNFARRRRIKIFKKYKLKYINPLKLQLNYTNELKSMHELDMVLYNVNYAYANLFKPYNDNMYETNDDFSRYFNKYLLTYNETYFFGKNSEDNSMFFWFKFREDFFINIIYIYYCLFVWFVSFSEVITQVPWFIEHKEHTNFFQYYRFYDKNFFSGEHVLDEDEKWLGEKGNLLPFFFKGLNINYVYPFSSEKLIMFINEFLKKNILYFFFKKNGYYMPIFLKIWWFNKYSSDVTWFLTQFIDPEVSAKKWDIVQDQLAFSRVKGKKEWNADIKYLFRDKYLVQDFWLYFSMSDSFEYDTAVYNWNHYLFTDTYSSYFKYNWGSLKRLKWLLFSFFIFNLIVWIKNVVYSEKKKKDI